MANVSFSNIKKSFGTVDVIHGISLDIEDGEFVALVGPSGCGKTTLLRMIAGLEDPTSGEIRIGNEVVNNKLPKDRDIAMVFQSYALYPHMSVYENMAFSLRLQKRPEAEVDRAIKEASEILDLTQYLSRKPKALSGGQRQRVAMGRAIVRDPSVFLFDEPLSNLDAKLRTSMRKEVKILHQRLKTTSLYVTHDQTEAMTMADRIVIMNGGNIEQVGTPLELYNQPANIFVAGFIGSPQMNFLCGKVKVGKKTTFIHETGEYPLPDNLKLNDNTSITLGIRPEDLQHDDKGTLTAVVEVAEPMGKETHLTCRLKNDELRLIAGPELNSGIQSSISLSYDLSRVHLFLTEDGSRIR